MDSHYNLTEHFEWGEFWSNSLSGARIEPPEIYFDDILKMAENLEKIRVAIDR